MPNPYLTQPFRRRVLTLIGVYAAFAFVIGDASAYPTVLPVAMFELGGQQYYALGTAVGGILAVVAVPFLGFISAHRPHLRPTLLVGALSIEAVAIALRGIAPNIGLVIVAGIFLSVGTAGSYVIGLPMIRDMFPVMRASLLLGLVGTASSIGQIAAPLGLGRMIDDLGWRSVSALMAPLMIVAALLVFLGARITKAEGASIAESHGRFDAAGGILVTAFVTFLFLPLSLGEGSIPYGGWLNTALFLGAAVAVALFVAVVRRKKDAAYIPESVFRDRNTLALTIQTFLSTGSAIIVLVFGPLYLLLVLHGTAFQSGLASAMFAVPGLFLAPLIGRWIGRSGSAAGVIYASTVFKVLSMVGLGVMILAVPDHVGIWTIYVAMLVAGVYNAGATVTVQTAPQIMLSHRMRTPGTAAVSAQLTLGPIIGIAAFGGIVTGHGPERGIPIAILAASAAALLALIPVWFFRPLRGAEAVQTAEAVESAVEARAEARHAGAAATVGSVEPALPTTPMT